MEYRKSESSWYNLYTKETYTYPNLELYVMKQDKKSVDAAKEKNKRVFK